MSDGNRLNIAIAGGSGLIGRHLAAFWLREGHRIVLISRKARSPKSIELMLRPEHAAFDAATPDKPAEAAEAGNVECRTWEELRTEPEKAGTIDAGVHRQ